jgi:hypothetical protein
MKPPTITLLDDLRAIFSGSGFDIAVLIGILFMLDLLVVSLMITVITILSQ